MEIEKLVNAQKAYFTTGATLPLHFRLEKLKALKASIIAHETEIAEALRLLSCNFRCHKANSNGKFFTGICSHSRRWPSGKQDITGTTF